MDRPARISRLPAPRLPFKRRPAISGPIGPVQHNTLPISANTEDAKGVTSADTTIPGRDGLSDAVEPPPTCNALRPAPAARPPTPDIQELDIKILPYPQAKSRTLNVFSNISQSLSRASLIPSRHTNYSSAASASSVSLNTAVLAVAAAVDGAVIDPPPSRLPKSKSSRWSLGSHKAESTLSQDPCLIYEAQPSAFWTGRFMSLHDKFQSESLTQQNMQSLILAHSQRARETNQRSCFSSIQDIRYSRYNTRLPPSATSAAVLQQTGGNMADAKAHAEAALLLDDDERCKRVFLHLGALCQTDEARESLRSWQQDYARKTGRKKLLPLGGAMERSHGSYFSRILGGRKNGKRASIL